MSDVIAIDLKLNDRNAVMGLLGAMYRQALVEIGYSPDEHVYDLDRDFLMRHKDDSLSVQFVLQILDYYESLPDFGRRVFLCECLERGRHYNWWWLEFMDPKNYRRFRNRLFAKTLEGFLS